LRLSQSIYLDARRHASAPAVLNSRKQTAVEEAIADLPPFANTRLIQSLKCWLRNQTGISDGKLASVLRELQAEQG
jgi:hypothetical protein